MTKTSFAVAFLMSACVIADGDDPTCAEGKCDLGWDLEVAQDLPAECTSSEIVRIERPVDSARPGDTFAYGFRFKAPSDPAAPVLVYLPGGPGQSSIASPPMFVPEGWGYLMTDPRGVGCNRLAKLPAADVSGTFFSTREIANDVVAAIGDRKLSHYILFGISYGTALGTTVAHALEERGLARPDAVVLEGVLGRAFGADFAGAEYITQWHRVHDVLPADVVAELDTSPQPYGIDPLGWSKILMGLLPRGPGPTADFLVGLSNTQTADVRNQVLAVLDEIRNEPPMTADANELYRQVACRELMDTVPANDLDVVFERGDLVRNSAQEGTKCRELHITTPYDSAALPFATPLYLFIGESDVATPAWQGGYHFEHHAGPTVRVTTRNGGHNSLELDQLDCAPRLMAAIAAGGTDLASAAVGCPRQTTIDRK